MKDQTDDQAYAEARAFEEREAAAQSSCLARAAHEELAELYEAVAAGEVLPPRTGTVGDDRAFF